MPVTTRRWPTAAQMAGKMMVRVKADNPLVRDTALGTAVEASIEAWFDAGGHTIERKLARLTEKLKDQIELGAFGPLMEASGVVRTPVGDVFKAFQDIYEINFLALFDEEGDRV